MAPAYLAILISAALILGGAYGQFSYSSSQVILDPRVQYLQDLAKFCTIQHNACANTSINYSKLLASRYEMGRARNWLIIQDSIGSQYEAFTVQIAQSNANTSFSVLRSFEKLARPLDGYKFLDPSDKGAQKAAIFAVNTYNKQKHAQLQYAKLFEAQKQVKNGSSYSLVVHAFDNSYGHQASGNYFASVFSGIDRKQTLLRFMPIY